MQHQATPVSSSRLEKARAEGAFPEGKTGASRSYDRDQEVGKFRSFWTTFDQSVNLMASREVVTQPMISPAVTAARKRGIPCVFQPLREG